jgi:phosphoribosylanthranilate isomerase
MTLVKICGITDVQDARTATKAGANFLGFVFYPKSPRYVTQKLARDIVIGLHRTPLDDRPHTVGVFVDETFDTVAQTMDFCRLDFAQLHGSETPEMVAMLTEQGFSVIKAFRIRDSLDLVDMARYHATAYLLDTYVPGQPGGTGHRFDWTLAGEAKKQGRIILAGGLTPDNVAQAVRVAQPWAVDVSSGVEKIPGRKNPDRIRRFIRRARAPENEGSLDDHM